jgi:uncharacterized membrane protein
MNTPKLLPVTAAILFCATLAIFGMAAADDNAVLGDTPSAEGGAAPRGANYILSIVANNATQWINPTSTQKSATYGFQVKNNGDTGLPECNLQLTPWSFPPEKWSYTFIPSCPFSVSPGETKTVLLVIYPAPDAEAKRYTFALKGIKDVATNSISINLDIKQYGDVFVRAPPTQAANPGETLEFHFEIVNTGNGKDRFYIVSVETSVPTMVPVLKDNSNWTADLNTQKFTIKTVVVIVPYDLKTSEGSAGFQLSMTARSTFCQTADDVNWTLIQVYHIYDVSIGISPANASLLPGEQASFTVTILNLGNGYDNITLNITASFDFSSWTVSLGRNWFNVSAGRQNTTALKITPPLNALRGSNYKMELTARSSGPPFPELPVERSEPISIVIRQVKELRAPVQNFTAPSPIGPGEVVRFGFNFTNRGNGEDLVNITVTQKPLNWYASLDVYLNIRMQPYTTQEVSLTVQASVNHNESLYQSYMVTLQITNADRSSVINCAFTIPVRPVYEWDFSVDEPNGLVNPYANPKHSFTLVFTNRGNVGDEVTLSLGGDYAAWGKLDTTALSLAYGERKSVRLAVEVPQTAEVGREYGLKVTAGSQKRPEIIKEYSVAVAIFHQDVSIVPAGSLEISNQVWKDFKTTVGQKLNITVTIRNDGTESMRAVNVRFYDNAVVFAERNSSIIAPLKTARFTVVWEALALGPHAISAKADPVNVLGEVNENNNEGVSNIAVKNVPPPGGANLDSGGMLYTLASIALICVAVGVAYFVYQRRPKYDRELYESIYGKKGDLRGDDTQMAAERAEVEKRALEKTDDIPAATYGYDTPAGLTEEDFAQQPGGTVAEPAYASGVTMDLGESVPPPVMPQEPGQPAEPAPPTEPQQPAPPKKKKISIRPAK